MRDVIICEIVITLTNITKLLFWVHKLIFGNKHALTNVDVFIFIFYNISKHW